MLPGLLSFRHLLIGIGALAASAWAHAAGGQLTIHLEQMQAGDGTLRASLYDMPDSFRKEDRARRIVTIPASPDTRDLIFEDVPPGRYAVMVYHDANDDRKLNLRFGMFPIEGYGLSNNPSAIGPPRFDDSAFEHDGTDTRITVRINY